jgi:hypothetical protein
MRELVFNLEIWEANPCNQSLRHINERTNFNTHLLTLSKKLIVCRL